MSRRNFSCVAHVFTGLTSLIKYPLSILMLASLTFTSYAQIAKQKIDTDNGFYDVKLGSGIEAHPEMVYTDLGGDNDPSLRYYQRRLDSLSFASIPLSSVRYAYYKGKLGSILLQTDAKQRVALRQALVARYGKPIRYSKAYEWTGQHAIVFLNESDSVLSWVLIASYEFKKMTQARMNRQARE